VSIADGTRDGAASETEGSSGGPGNAAPASPPSPSASETRAPALGSKSKSLLGEVTASTLGTKAMIAQMSALSSKSLLGEVTASTLGTKAMIAQMSALSSKSLLGEVTASTLGTKAMIAQMSALSSKSLLGEVTASTLGIKAMIAQMANFMPAGVNRIPFVEAVISDDLNGATLTTLPDQSDGSLLFNDVRLTEVWTEAIANLTIWLKRPVAKAIGIPAAIYLFAAWFLAFEAAHPAAAEHLRELFWGTLFLLLGLWATAKKNRD
jgi:hypothetical protein